MGRGVREGRRRPGDTTHGARNADSTKRKVWRTTKGRKA
jgi:hypothetical protein